MPPTAALLARSVTGLTGQTHQLVSGTPSQRFVEMDRRWYGPPILEREERVRGHPCSNVRRSGSMQS